MISRLIRTFCLIWLNLVFLILPIQFAFFPSIGRWLTEFLLPVNQFFFPDVTTEFILSSDSIFGYASLILMLILSLVISTIIEFTLKSKAEKFQFWLRKGLIFWIALFLLKYGLDKVFLHQFYTPEPNTLFTPLGQLDKDIAFWSVMGTSRSYNYFMGLIEIIPALLILFKRTRFLGLFISTGVLANVFVINLSFDITVKILSGVLFFTSLYLLSEYKSNLAKLVGMDLPEKNNIRTSLPKYQWVKTGFILLIFVESFSPYVDLTTNAFMTKRELAHHGSYEITGFEGNSRLFDLKDIHRIHIHNSGYLITENNRQEMTSLPIHVRITDSLIRLNQYLIEVDSKPNLTTFSWKEGPNQITINSEKIDLKSLPLLQDEFHFSVESILD